MSLWRALVYFFGEALSGLLRAWKSSLLAVLTISVSLFVLGAFLVVGGNVGRSLEAWRSEARVIVYLEAGVSRERQEELAAAIAETSWVVDVRTISAADARTRFARAFPSLADLMEGWSESPLPASIEVSLDPAVASAEVDRWLDELRAWRGVELVDDDRDWIGELERMADTLRTVGWVMSIVLLGAAAFTIGSVIRLAASTYRDEIAIMRMVGATEFLIRGPFYCEGLLQGALGSIVASAALWLLHAGLVTRGVLGGVVADLLVARFLSPLEIAALVAVGCFAGILGAVLSLRGETLVSAGE